MRWLLARRGAVLADAMGLGKTLAALDIDPTAAGKAAAKRSKKRSR